MDRPWKCYVVCAFLCATACKKEAASSGEPALPGVGEVLQKMTQREQALSAFSIQVQTEEAGGAVDYTLVFRAPDWMRVEVKQPNKVALSYDGQNHYRLEEAARKFMLLNIHLPMLERKMALSSLMGAFMPEGFQLPKIQTRNAKLSWEEPGRALRLENTLSEGGEAATFVYVLRWPSLDFLKKEVTVAGEEPVVFSMETEACPDKLCLPTRIVAKQGAAVVPQNIQLLSFKEAAANEHFVLVAPEGFAKERHSLSSLEQLAPFLQ